MKKKLTLLSSSIIFVSILGRISLIVFFIYHCFIPIKENDINQYLETPADGSNVFRPPLSEMDSAEMRGLKQSIIAKNIDMDKYAERFGPNYPNDKRKMKDSSITSFLLKRACKNLDINVDLVFSDAGPNVPNPMGKTITINMVPGISNDIDIRENEIEDDE